MDNLDLLQLIELETDPQLRKVLEQYRGAEIELNAASEQLTKTGRHRWAQAAASRARDVAWQAQRYMRIERERQLKLHDFMDDADTQPRGRPAGLADRLEPTPLGFPIAPPSEPPPPAERHARTMQWVLTATLWIVIAAALWLIGHFAHHGAR